MQNDRRGYKVLRKTPFSLSRRIFSNHIFENEPSLEIFVAFRKFALNLDLPSN